MLDINSVEYRQAATAINYDLEALFRKNMAYFSEKNSVLYQSAKNYIPKRMALRLDPKGYVNLLNLDTKTFVYPCDPSLYAEEQVKDFSVKRPHIAIRKHLAGKKRKGYPYTKYLKESEELYKEIKPDYYPAKQATSGAMFMFGGGLYLQLQFLLNKLDVKRLTILETDFDAFYCSMHVIDWSEIYRYFDRDGYSLDIIFVENNDKSSEKIAGIMINNGLHNYSKIDFFYHYKNQKLDYIAENIRAYCIWAVSGLGFFEDEKIGLVHTIQNISKANVSLPVKNNYQSIGEKAVIVIGNGPSLDSLIPFIKRNQDRLVLVSCGSAIGALMQHDIVPDIHVEQERMLVTKESILKGTDESFRKKLRLVALNPCHPDIFDMFKESYIAPKASDLGVYLLKKTCSKEIHSYVHCNPLVSNFGLSLVIDLGFRNIYLAGIDCGMVDVGHHHSKASNIYYNDAGVSKKKYKKEITVKGNFRDTVFSTDLFKGSKKALEAKIISVEGPLNVYNLNDGAFIDGATPFNVGSLEELAVKVIVGKDKFVDGLLKRTFKKNLISKDVLEKEVVLLREEAVEFIVQLKPLFIIQHLDKNELLNNFDKIEAMLRYLYTSNMPLYTLFNGSIRGIMLNVMHDRKVLSDKVYASYIPQVEENIITFLEEAEIELTTDFYKYDIDS